MLNKRSCTQNLISTLMGGMIDQISQSSWPEYFSHFKYTEILFECFPSVLVKSVQEFAELSFISPKLRKNRVAV